MRRQVSEISKLRAVEQHKNKKMYEEEEEEEEEEMTDVESTGKYLCSCIVFVTLMTLYQPDTSDDEFVQGPEADGAEMSDVCSDLDEEEGEEGDEGEGSGSSGVTSSSQLRPLKKKLAWRLDSDDDDEDERRSDGDLPPLRLDSVGESTSSSPRYAISSSQPAPVREPLTGYLDDSGKGVGYTMGSEDRKGGDRETAEKKAVSDGVLEEGSNATTADGDSLEMSFQWGQSLPLAQPFNPLSVGVVRRKLSLSHEDTISTQDILREESQATPTCATRNQSQDNEEDETQFLDEDG